MPRPAERGRRYIPRLDGLRAIAVAGGAHYIEKSSLEGREITELLRNDTYSGGPMTVAP